MAAISAELSDLEVKLVEDGSWHPCRVSLSPSSGIIIDFENYAGEDIISNRKDAVRRLRFRSIPLQRGECFHIKEGECVLAMHKVQYRTLFFDAVVEKTNRVKHSNRVFCRCTFEIRWLNRGSEETLMTVSSSSIMKLSERNISSHPVLNPFLNTLSPTDGLEVSPSLSLSEETDYEADLHGLLEKQIEEISNMANISSKCTENSLLVAKKGKTQNNSSRSTRSRKNQEAEMEIKMHLEDRPLLSPLAARAALASLMHEIPIPSFSIQPSEEDDHLSQPVKNPKKQSIACIFVDYDASSPTKNSRIDSLVEARFVSRSSASDRSPEKKSDSNVFPELSPRQALPTRASTTVKQTRSSKIDKKLSSRAITTRVTRSTVQKDIIDLTAEDPQSSTECKQNGRGMTTTRTRSAVQSEVLDSNAEVAQESANWAHNSPMDTRGTRSGKSDGASNPSTMRGLGKSRLTEGLKVSSIEDIITPEKVENKKNNVSSPPQDADAALNHKKKRTRALADIPAEEKGEISRGVKKGAIEDIITPVKSVVRFSPRLRYLPGTRSQNSPT